MKFQMVNVNRITLYLTMFAYLRHLLDGYVCVFKGVPWGTVKCEKYRGAANLNIPEIRDGLKL